MNGKKRKHARFGMTEELFKALSNFGNHCVKEYEQFEKMKNLKYSYYCPECGTINRFESEVNMIMCSECSHVFDIEIQQAIKELEKENPYLRMSAYPMEDEIKKEKAGITSEEALKAFSDLGEALRKDMVREEPEQKPAWKILDVNDLSECPDILTGVYEFENIQEHISPLDILSGCVMGQKRRYRRKTTTTKKTHEELAEEYARLNFVTGYGETVINAFIAGRKSMEES